MAITKYLVGSMVGSLVVVWHAVLTRDQFYPAMEYLSTSKISLAVLGNMGFAGALLMYHMVTKAFLGTLRDYEVERVHDRVGQAIIETLLAMTIFRQNLESFSLLSQFVMLAFMKIFHWLAQDRVDFIETAPNVTVLQHLRLGSMIVFLMVADLFMLHVALGKTFTYGVSVHLLFAFEYLMQTSMAMAVLVKYAFSLVDLQMHGNWRGKSVAVFYVELTRDLVHLITSSAFFFVVFSTYGIPIHLIRDIYWTFRNFQTRVSDFLRYRQISANMENRFPDATEEDLERVDHMCIVCREEMVASAKRLPCNHVFHLECLKSWLERQQNCPICRTPISASATRQERDRAAAGAAAAPPPPLPAAAAENLGEHRDAGEPHLNNNDINTEEDRSHQQEEEYADAPQHGSSTRPSSSEQQQEQEENTDLRHARQAFLRQLEQQRGNTNEEAQPSTSQEERTQCDNTASPQERSKSPQNATSNATTSRSEEQQHHQEHVPMTGTTSHHEAVLPTSLVFAYPGIMPSPVFVPTQSREEEERLSQLVAQEIGVQPTEEQHARALAVARAAVQAASAAYTLQQAPASQRQRN
ncbi:ERAD-associated E3 ubiquitin-protein ligase HRD1B [Picochlorum sp. SENEW3]|nr:ERAD-associated E3 ubiquitin-protein ligase HRD1B [Picochlorum sp. SENEW3]WPT14588.1 ERAD-associated E3 ubiquitin-protein ligase HRD1B [Picochlorum sp. SENEW3]